MAVAVDDEIARTEVADEPLVPAGCRAGVVHEADPHAFGFDEEPLGQQCTELGIVHVAVHGLDRPELAKLREDGRGREVAHVKDRRRVAEELPARVRQASYAPRKVRVPDERDQGAPSRKRPSR